MLKIVEGDLLHIDANVKSVIVQQCNCLTVTSHGLSQSIASKWPEADIYAHRRKMGNRNLSVVEDRGTPGSCIITSINDPSIDKEKYVAALLGQWRPGKVTSKWHSVYPESNPPETNAQREIWFKQSLINLEQQVRELGIQVVAFPLGIGCGLAGGNWNNYLLSIGDFANRNSDLIVYIVKKF